MLFLILEIRHQNFLLHVLDLRICWVIYLQMGYQNDGFCNHIQSRGSWAVVWLNWDQFLILQLSLQLRYQRVCVEGRHHVLQSHPMYHSHGFVDPKFEVFLLIYKKRDYLEKNKESNLSITKVRCKHFFNFFWKFRWECQNCLSWAVFHWLCDPWNTKRRLFSQNNFLFTQRTFCRTWNNNVFLEIRMNGCLCLFLKFWILWCQKLQIWYFNISWCQWTHIINCPFELRWMMLWCCWSLKQRWTAQTHTKISVRYKMRKKWW